MGLLHTVEAWSRLETSHLMARFHGSRGLGAGALHDLVSGLRLQASVTRSGRPLVDLAQVYWHKSTTAGDTSVWRRETELALAGAVARSPTLATAWTRLAGLYYREGELNRVSRSLVMSSMAGRPDMRTVYARVRLALYGWPEISEHARSLIGRDFAAAWAEDRRRMVELARRYDRIDAVRSSLARFPRVLAEYDKITGRYDRTTLGRR